MRMMPLLCLADGSQAGEGYDDAAGEFGNMVNRGSLND